MSDEEQSPAEEEPTVSEPEPEALKDVKSSLKQKFRLTSEEEILKDVKPSIFAFIPMYAIALLILGAHLLFSIEWTTNDDDNILVKIMVWLIELSEKGEIGFVLVMLAITWFNRMMNGTTSGKWTTMFLLVVALTPPVLRIDDFIAWMMDKDSGFIPLDSYNFFFFGIFWASLFTVLTVFYPKIAPMKVL